MIDNIERKKQSKGVEKFINIIFTVYTITMILLGYYEKWNNIQLCLLFLNIALCWGICARKTVSYNVKQIICTILMNFNVLIVAINSKDFFHIVILYMSITVICGLYGNKRLVYISTISYFVIFFYHIGIQIDMSTIDSNQQLKLFQNTANVLIIQFVIYFWNAKRQITAVEQDKIIGELKKTEYNKDAFLADISHEIRTPINTINGMSDIAMYEEDPTRVREELWAIQNAGRNLMSVINDIFDFSELQSGKMTIDEESYNISSMVNDIINLSVAWREDKDIELIVDYDAMIPCELIGDEQKIKRIVLNLVNNAIKFTNQGGVIIGISFRKEDYGANLCISVKDTGLGMSREFVESIFESQNADIQSQYSRGGGIGLGLAIIKVMVAKMNGMLTINSEEGKGSEVKVVIPQKVGSYVPSVEIGDYKDINVALYIDMEKYRVVRVRDEYKRNVWGIVSQLGINCYSCNSLIELKNKDKQENFTHIFITLEEYSEDREYFDNLAMRKEVIIVEDNYRNRFAKNKNIRCIVKPFNIMSFAALFNEYAAGGMKVYNQNEFTTRNVHILVVDDNSMNIMVVKGLLEKYNVEVTEALSGLDALSKVHTREYDFIFMDHMMPEMDGIETMHRIREKTGSYFKEVPIIALTANAIAGKREMFINEGFDDFLEKPIEIRLLEKILLTHIAKNKIVYKSEEPEYVKRKLELQNQESRSKYVSSVIENNNNVVYNENLKSKERTDEIRNEEANITTVKEERHELFTKNEKVVIRSSETENKNLNTYEENEKEDTIHDEKIEYPKELNTEKGFMYCGGEDRYLDILQVYSLKLSDLRKEISDFYEKKDWKNYVINVHALKGLMLNIGVDKLSELAKSLELAGKDDKIDYILKNHDDMMIEFNKIYDVIKKFMDKINNKEIEETPKTEIESRQTENVSTKEEISEEKFDEIIVEFENAMYSFDDVNMKKLIKELNEYSYLGIDLSNEISAIEYKIDMEDYMSAFDALATVKKKINDNKKL